MQIRALAFLALSLVTTTSFLFASPAAPEDAEPQQPPAPADPRKGTRIVHFGDSFVSAGLSQALQPKLDELGVTYKVYSHASSTTNSWAYEKNLSQILSRKPDLVIITLGANELFIPKPESRADAVRAIVKKIGSRPCVWVTPPPWKGQTGILDIIRDNASPCLFFDSEAAVSEPIARQKDKIHPSLHGGRVWGNAFWAWLEEHRDPERGPWALRPDTRNGPVPPLAQ